MADKKHKGGIWSIVKGEWFSLDGYKKYSAWVIFFVALPMIYMCFKFDIQVKRDKIAALNRELTNERTNMIHITSQFGSKTRESEMTVLADSLKLNLKAPEQPPFYLD